MGMVVMTLLVCSVWCSAVFFLVFLVSLLVSLV